MKTGKLIVTVLICILVSFVIISGSGCRPDDTIPDADSTVVVIDDGYIPENIGVWEADTFTTMDEYLIEHQNMLNDVFFDFDSDELSDEALMILQADAAYIMNNPGFGVKLEGHCDERGTIDYNLALGEGRAITVYNYLVGYGVAPGRLEYITLGKESPFDFGHDEAAWAANRRVHFQVIIGD